MLINKRRNSDPAAAGGNNANLDIPTPRENNYRTLFICYYMVELFEFVRFFKIDGIWGPEGGVSRRVKFSALTIRYDSHKLKFLLFFSSLLITSPTYYGLRLTTPLSCLFTSDLICGFSQWMVTPGRRKITKHHKKADSPPPPPPPVAQQILFGNPPPLLDLINRHSLVISFWCVLFYIRSHILIMIYFFLANLLTGLINLTIPTILY